MNPVKVRSLISSVLPADPLQRLEQTHRAMSYQNAFIRAGWQMWSNSLREAETRYRGEQKTYEAKLDYLNKLQDSMNDAVKEADTLETKRQAILKDIELGDFKAKVQAEQQYAKGQTQAGLETVKRRVSIYQTQAREAGANARAVLREEQANERARLAAESRERISTSRGTKDDPLKEFGQNKTFVENRYLEFASGGFDIDKADEALDLARKDFVTSTGGLGTDRAVDVSTAVMFDKMGTGLAVQNGIDPEVAKQALMDSLTPTQRDSIKKGQEIMGVYTEGQPGGVTPSTGAGIRVGGGGGAPASIGTPTSGVTAPGLGYSVKKPEVPTIDRTVGQPEFDASRARALERIKALEALLVPAPNAPTPEIIKTAQQIFADRYLAPAVKQQKPKAMPEPVSTIAPKQEIADPFKDLKRSALSSANDYLRFYGNIGTNDVDRQTWDAFEKDPTSSVVKELFMKVNTPEQIPTIKAQLSEQYSPLNNKELAKQAMTAFIVYSKLYSQNKLK